MCKKNYTSLVLLCLSFSLLPVVIQQNVLAAETPLAATKTSQKGVVAGKVLETMDAAGYTYFKVDTGTAQEWVAVPKSVVIVGDPISFYEGVLMENFFSRRLSRTFETVIFSPGIVGQVPKEIVEAVNAAPKQVAAEETKKDKEPADLESRLPDTKHMPRQINPAMPSGGSVAAVAMQETISSPKAEGEHAFTVAEIYSKRDELNSKTVRLRGKVVKYSPNIMGRNWLHIQDGSGSVSKNSHDLVVTTTEVPTNMDDVTIEGTVAADKDFGSGYRYSVIVEEARILQ